MDTLSNQGEEIKEEEEAPVNDLTEAIPSVLKKALMHDGLVRGLKEVVKAIDGRRVVCCFLAQSCEEEAYKLLVKSLCKEYNVPVIQVPNAKDLGEWSGLCQIDKEGKPRNIVGAACVAITDYGEESPALNFLQQHIENMRTEAVM